MDRLVSIRMEGMVGTLPLGPSLSMEGKVEYLAIMATQEDQVAIGIIMR